MSIWLFRAGKNGEYEEKFLTDNRIYLTWHDLKINLNDYKDRATHLQKLQELYPSEKINTLKNWESQIYPIAHRMKIGDWIVLRAKGQVQSILVKLSESIHMMLIMAIHTAITEVSIGLRRIFPGTISTKIFYIHLVHL